MKRICICLIELALALVVVGVVSGTIIRHLVQITPIALALIMLRMRPAVGAYAALALFAFWTSISILIWMFLLGLSRIANGTYTPIEVASTIVMAVAGVTGAISCVNSGRALPVAGRVATFVAFGVLQVAVMMVSFSKGIANR